MKVNVIMGLWLTRGVVKVPMALERYSQSRQTRHFGSHVKVVFLTKFPENRGYADYVSFLIEFREMLTKKENLLLENGKILSKKIVIADRNMKTEYVFKSEDSGREWISAFNEIVPENILNKIEKEGYKREIIYS